jgi:formylmethanofuran dehydrogenase subunit E
MDNESAEYLRTPDWYYDQVKCEACGQCVAKDDAERCVNGDWLCDDCAKAVERMEDGRIA